MIRKYLFVALITILPAMVFCQDRTIIISGNAYEYNHRKNIIPEIFSYITKPFEFVGKIFHRQQYCWQDGIRIRLNSNFANHIPWRFNMDDNKIILPHTRIVIPHRRIFINENIRTRIRINRSMI